jgi:hypothetical protein
MSGEPAVLGQELQHRGDRGARPHLDRLAHLFLGRFAVPGYTVDDRGVVRAVHVEHEVEIEVSVTARVIRLRSENDGGRPGLLHAPVLDVERPTGDLTQPLCDDRQSRLLRHLARTRRPSVTVGVPPPP